MKDYVTNYEEAVEMLYRIPRFHSNHFLSNICQVLSAMGNPDKKMQIVHIAGTNGKGSTAAYLAALLQAGGYKVGLFTSPHLVDIRERFQVNGRMIEKALLVEAVQEVSCLLREIPQYTPCFFDMMFFIGMYAFSKEEVDILILETGLGGTLDATNAVSKKALTLITHIGLDHTEILGDTLEKIALEKAGIMMPSVPCVVGAHNEGVSHIFLKKSEEIGAECRILGKDDYRCHSLSEKSVAFSYISRYYGTIEIVLSTTAFYQVENVSLAMAGLERLIESGIVDLKRMSIEAIKSALFQTTWQGRMEEVFPHVYLDGAHNVDGIEAFLNSVKHTKFKGRRFLVFSAVSDKAYAEMLSSIVESTMFDEIVVTQVKGERAVEAEVLYERLQATTPKMLTKCIPDLKDALQYILTKRQPIDDIYIVGSLYLVGQTKILLDHLEFSAKEEGELV